MQGEGVDHENHNPEPTDDKVSDLYIGLLFLAFGGVFGLTSLSYRLGSIDRMGSGYFPLTVSVLITVIGLILIARAVVAGGVPKLRHLRRPRALALVLASSIAFGLLISRTGLVVAVLATVLLARLADSEGRIVESLVLAVVISVIAVLIFVVGLKLPLNTWM